jgi:hypothetical protein
MKHYLLLTLPLLALLALLAGCSSELETGYRPQKLGASEDVRRAYYAPAFSPEKQAAGESEMNELKARRPGSH